ncbi:MAG: GntR family transcriptional regulator [Bacteroidetes bacterium]|nr:GntR family transcriptional regulator [Bacteroidota bacterium]MBT6688019.1 GntR family transcriptional regulator [Bacteroidota bacterium]MBT7144817.1 GntR family transcriptional regulator [Bacteroidota bacterium]MBT7492408.1 GntR family transcriptional regulator [Bacteroidota bacterium]
MRMEIGKTNKLTVARNSDFGFYLIDDDKNEVLLPNSYVSEDLKIADDIEVFIYKDSENRIIATNLKPFIQLGEFAVLQAKDVNEYGAFMDWGLAKDLFVPFGEQTKKMEAGNWYLIYLLLDEETNRLIGSNKVKKFLHFDEIDVKQNDQVDLLLFDRTELGINAIVNNKYKGLIFNSDIHKNIQAGDKMSGFIKQVREDGKIDLSLEPIGYKNSIDINSEIIISALKNNNGLLELTDKSSPENIKYILGLSKKAFKKALGNLYKNKIVELHKNEIKLIK